MYWWYTEFKFQSAAPGRRPGRGVMVTIVPGPGPAVGRSRPGTVTELEIPSLSSSENPTPIWNLGTFSGYDIIV